MGSVSETGKSDGNLSANMENEESGDDDDSEMMGKSILLRRSPIVFIDFASLTDAQDFVTESCSLPKILDGKFYKVSTTVSLTYTVKATCMECNREVGGSIKSTGNFYSHIDKKHPELSESCRAYSQNRRQSDELHTLQIRRLLTKRAHSPIKEINIDASMWRPSILDGKYFVLTTLWSNGNIAAICQFCRRRIRAKLKKTSNLLTHIRARHKEHFEECKTYSNVKKGGSETNHKWKEISDEKVIFSDHTYLSDPNICIA